MMNKRRFAPGVLLALAGCFLLLLYAPLQTYLQNTDDFTYDFLDLLRMTVPVFAAAFAAAAVLVCLICALDRKGKVYKALLAAELFLFAVLYIEGTFMSHYLPTLNGAGIAWENYSVHRYYDAAMFVAVAAAAVFAAMKMNDGAFKSLCAYVGGFGVLMLALTLVFSLNQDTLRDKRNFYASTDKMLSVSPDDTNLIILLLDDTDGGDLSDALSANPEYSSLLQDFTFYNNTLGVYCGTKWSVPYIVSGQWFENQCSYYRYKEQAYLTSPLFSTLDGNGYEMGMYDEELPQVEGLDALFENLAEPENDSFAHPDLFRKMQLMLTGLSYLPYDLKPLCELTPDNVYYDSLKETSGTSVFRWGNDGFLSYLRSQGISMAESPCFRFIHLQGTHTPFEYQQNIDSSYRNSYEDSIDICFRLCGEFLSALKDAGVYDNSAIIILGDHGEREPKVFNQNPALFVKGINEKHEFRISDAPISYEDLMDAYFRLIEGASGDEVFDARAGDVRERRFLSTYVRDDQHIVEYIHTGHASDASGLKETGRVFTP